MPTLEPPLTPPKGGEMLPLTLPKGEKSPL